jgi:hypothetical protein
MSAAHLSEYCGELVYSRIGRGGDNMSVQVGYMFEDNMAKAFKTEGLEEGEEVLIADLVKPLSPCSSFLAFRNR